MLLQFRHDRSECCAGQFQVLGQAIRGPARAGVVVANDQVHDRQREPFAHGRAQPDLAASRAQVLRILHIEGELGAEQQHQPGNVYPDERDDDDGETGVDHHRAARGFHERRQDHACRHPGKTGHGAADQRRYEAHVRVRNEAVQEREDAHHQQVRAELAQQRQQPADDRIVRQRLHECAAVHRGEQADGAHQHRRADHHHAQILAEAPAEAARLIDAPDEIKALLDLLHHRDDGVEQEDQADGAEHAAAYVVDEFHHLRGDVVGLVAERFEERVEHRLEFAVIVEALEHGEGQGDQRHDRQQRRVHQAHGAQREIVAQHVADQRVGIAQDAGQLPERLADQRFGRFEQPVFDARGECVHHEASA